MLGIGYDVEGLSIDRILIGIDLTISIPVVATSDFSYDRWFRLGLANE